MSEGNLTLLNRFLALPRAIQWALLAALGIVLFFAWDSQLAPMSARLDRESNEIQAQVDAIRRNRELAEALTRVDRASRPQGLGAVVVGLGQVKTPRSAAEGTRAVTDVVNRLMKDHSISDQDFSLRTRGKLPKNVLVQVLNNKRAERLTGELKFSARPEVALAILAELETSPDIEQVASVRMTKDSGGKVKVQFTLEAWVISVDTTSPGGMGTSL